MDNERAKILVDLYRIRNNASALELMIKEYEKDLTKDDIVLMILKFVKWLPGDIEEVECYLRGLK